MADWHLVRELFEDALALPEGERAAFLMRADDPDVRAEAARLLAHASGNEAFLQPPPASDVRQAMSPDAGLAAGDRIGDYVLESWLGAGGMGSVWTARQSRPERLVALKVMHGRLGAAALRRFELEAEVLGRLRHPGIAAIHELGSHRTAQGLEHAFFAMELVEDARDLVRFAHEEELGLRERLALFRQVCDAVEHAHRRGVIHRDLKPGNILVDSSGRPKVIDYGIARVVEPGSRSAVETLAGSLYGTLQYISPEQLSAGPQEVDTRSDVYSLGVVLYELLAGRLPYQVADKPIQEIVREICDVVPPPPSSSNPGLAPDLDWVVGRAMEKERERRYSSAAELGEDLARFERSEPVLAGPPTARYRLRKFAARHRIPVAAAALALTSLLAAVVMTSFALVEARERRTAAEEAQQVATREARTASVALRQQTAIVDAVQGMIEAVSPEQQGRSVTLNEVLERSQGTLPELEQDPDVRAALLAFLGGAYNDLGLYERAGEVLEQALVSIASTEEPDRRMRGRVRTVLARIRIMETSYDEAEQLIASAIEDLEAGGQDPRHHVNACKLQAELLEKRGRLPEAVAAYGALADRAEQALGPDDQTTIQIRSHLAMLLAGVGRNEEALALARRSHERARELYGSAHYFTAQMALNLGIVLERPAPREAVALLEETVSNLLEIYGPQHRNTALAMSALASAYLSAGESEPAEVTARQALATVLEVSPDDVRGQAEACLPLARALGRLGRGAEAVQALEETLARMQESGVAHPTMVELRSTLAGLLAGGGRFEDALQELEEAIELGQEVFPPGHMVLTEARVTRGHLLLRLGRAADAEAEYRAAYEGLVALADPAAERVARQLLPHLISATLQLGRPAEREHWESLLNAPVSSDR